VFVELRALLWEIMISYIFVFKKSHTNVGSVRSGYSAVNVLQFSQVHFTETRVQPMEQYYTLHDLEELASGLNVTCFC
jgi:hypothetical protein